MNIARKTVLSLAVVLFAAWCAHNFQGRILDGQDAVIRFVLGVLFCLLMLFRWKPAEDERTASGAAILAWGVIGTIMAVAGIILPVCHVEWLGILLMLYACLRWALPAKFGRDIVLALFLLYWIHRMPWRVLYEFQAWMQILSVKGSEWLLQCFNQRVWADGAALRTSYLVFNIPGECSGMRTAVTVLLSSLGIGLLFRFMWLEIAAFLVLGAAQVLVLNILRICFTVIWAPRMPVGWGAGFLHDTLGIFLLAAIVLVQAEAVLWRGFITRRKRKEKAIETGEAEPPEKGSILPRFWHHVVNLRWVIVTVPLVAVLAAAVAYRSRPAHRAAMIEGVVEGLMETKPADAERAADAGLRLNPASRRLRSQKIQALVMMGRFEEALGRMERLGGGLNTFEALMKSWSLMELGRVGEAVAIIDGLSGGEKAMPGVALVRASYAARQDDPETAARNAVIAAQSHKTIGGVRGLFPYLAAHGQWRAIAGCNNPDAPFSDFEPALIAVHANLALNNISAAGGILRQAMAVWPKEPRFLASLCSLAAIQPGGEWEDLFAADLVANVASLDADRASTYITHCFQMNRPDLGWLVYERLKAIDPADPALFLAPARFGNAWFTFRKRRLGMESQSAYETVDLRSLCGQTRNLEPFRSFWQRVPLAAELAGGDGGKAQEEFLRLCIAELNRRGKQGRLTERMELMYPTALLAGRRYDEAYAKLDEIGKKYPGKRRDILFQQACIHDQQKKWQDSYEALLVYLAAPQPPNLNAEGMLATAMMNMNMGICAMAVTQRARRVFPGAPELDGLTAAIWDTFGCKDQALFVLSRSPDANNNPVFLVRLLRETGRFKEAEKIAAGAGISVPRDRSGLKQSLALPAAELALAGKWPAAAPDRQADAEADNIERQLKDAASPFMRGMGRLAAEWHRARGRGAASDPDRWIAAGRNDLERAAALNRLTVLLACRGELDRARGAAEKALEILPDSAMLWRTAIQVAGGDAGMLARARKMCPDDPDIWLAWLVTRAGREGEGKWAMDEIQNAARAQRYPVETMVRAGDFLLRKGMKDAAAAAARDAMSRCRGLLPAYMLGLKCALEKKDLKSAMSCALKAAENGLDPAPFYRMIVSISAPAKSIDPDLVAALEYLHEKSPEDMHWTGLLAQIYFKKGNMKRVLSLLDPALEKGGGRVGVQALLLAAEAARLDGRPARAVSILETAYASHPDRLIVLNNLVYNLAQGQKTLARARDLLPRLLEMGGESFAVLDTASVVCMKSGQTDLAEKYMERALKALDRKAYLAQEVNLNAAEIMFHRGEYGKAKQAAQAILRDAECSPLAETGARKLLAEIEKAQEKEKDKGKTEKQ